MRTAIFVLGMHRSGTSALTRVLSLLGAALPRNLYPAGLGNERGHWEPEAAVRLHERILAAAGTSSNELCGPPDAWFVTADAEAFLPSMKALVRDEFGDAPLAVLKDPRSALVFPLWRRALAELGMRCLPVVVSRHPLEVAQSMASRQAAAQAQTWSLDRGGLLWLRYVLAAERHTRGAAPHEPIRGAARRLVRDDAGDGTRAFCLYGDLLDDWRGLAERLSGGLGVTWSRSPADAAPQVERFLAPELRHHHEPDRLEDRGGVWSAWIAPVYRALCEASAGHAPDPAVFDAVGRAFEDACASVRPGELPAELPAEGPAEGPAPGPGDRAIGMAGDGRLRVALVVTPFLQDAERAPHLRRFLDHAAAEGLAVTPVGLDAGIGADASIQPPFLRESLAVYRDLRDRAFDAIVYPDHEGVGYASMVARRAGLAFAGTTLCVVTVGSAAAQREARGEFPRNPVTLATEFIEQRATGWADVAGTWDELLAALSRLDRSTAGTPGGGDDDASAPDVTIVIPHFEQPALLEQNLEALAQQTDKAFRVIVVDDGSRSEATARALAGLEARHAGLGLRLIRQDNRYLGATRNAGIRAAQTEFVVLLDDDNVAFPGMVKTLRRAIRHSGADIVTCGIRHFHDATGRPHEGMAARGADHFFSGGPLLLGAIHNCFGDASGIYRRTLFARIGHFHEQHGVSFEDWQLHLRAAAAGLELLSLPEPLVWYRVRPDSMLRSTRRYDNARVIASVVDGMPAAKLAPLTDYLMGSEAELVRLHDEILRLGHASRLAAQGMDAVVAANAASLLETRDVAVKHASNLEAMLAERDRSMRDAEAYARSLEAALAELRASHEAASAYAAALECSRAEIEAYARSLEAALRKARGEDGGEPGVSP